MKINGMGIDPIKIYAAQLKKVDAEAKNKTEGLPPGDKLDISHEAKCLQECKGLLAKAPPVREELVASLKQRIQEGSYRPDSEKIAAGIIEEMCRGQEVKKGS
ncbi:MAG: flagellar biosynthesis anti-sigma factor FlgM [Candidatus Syntrophopropionicum ammoniitolerans]